MCCIRCYMYGKKEKLKGVKKLMPIGTPNTQTRATEKYQKKAGYISKSFKLKKELTDAFVEACNKNGESQASVISRYMKEYIENTK